MFGISLEDISSGCCMSIWLNFLCCKSGWYRSFSGRCLRVVHIVTVSWDSWFCKKKHTWTTHVILRWWSLITVEWCLHRNVKIIWWTQMQLTSVVTSGIWISNSILLNSMPRLTSEVITRWTHTSGASRSTSSKLLAYVLTNRTYTFNKSS